MDVLLTNHTSNDNPASKDNSLDTGNSTASGVNVNKVLPSPKMKSDSDRHHKKHHHHNSEKHSKSSSSGGEKRQHSKDEKSSSQGSKDKHHHHNNSNNCSGTAKVHTKSKDENKTTKDEKKKHKDVHNSSSKPKDSHHSHNRHTSPGSASKVKENNVAHGSPSKDGSAKVKENSSPSGVVKEIGKLKLKINNSNCVISSNDNAGLNSSPKTGTDGSKIKMADSAGQSGSGKLTTNSTTSSGSLKSGDRSKPEGGIKKEHHHKSTKDKDGKAKIKTEIKTEKIAVSPTNNSGPDLQSDDDDAPLSCRLAVKPAIKVEPEEEKTVEKTKTKAKKRLADDSSDEEPLSARVTKAKKTKKDFRKRKAEDSDDEPIMKKVKKNVQNKVKKEQAQREESVSPKKKGKKEEGQDVWKWWEEEKYENGIKWKTLCHKGPVFAPDYEPIPNDVTFLYNGHPVKLSSEAEEVASFYAKMLDHDYTTKEVFNKNFFKDWRKMMTPKERELITDLKKCNFQHMNKYFAMKNEERKAMTKEEKLELRKKNEEITQEYGFCIIDNHKEKIGNFKIEPPGLFRGRGEHPKMGMLKKRIRPEDVIINCSRGDSVPKPPPGHKWKEVRHDNTVTWLACWTENVQGQTKYVMLNASSKLKGEKDWGKYEVARRLKTCVKKIREQYQIDFKSKEMKVRQRAVALYFIDKLALRAGNEKEEGETADTVGCCSLRVEHIKLYEERNGQSYVVEFDFLGKDSIRYQNSVPVEKRVFKNLQIFMENKRGDDDLFDRLNTTILNKHLNELMEGLTAKVFRTYNASITLQQQLDALTRAEDSIPEKILAYNRANRAVAILCNHQRSVPKTFNKSMENLQNKIKAKQDQIDEAERELKKLKKAMKNSEKDRTLYERKKKAIDRLREQLNKLELTATDKEENKEIALGTSKLNYLDPRITVAWCKKWSVPVEKVYNRTQRDKFRWAIEMAGADFVF